MRTVVVSELKSKNVHIMAAAVRSSQRAYLIRPRGFQDYRRARPLCADDSHARFES